MGAMRCDQYDGVAASGTGPSPELINASKS